eukprot:jgi/Chrzof1/13425/Cz07g32160.t1
MSRPHLQSPQSSLQLPLFHGSAVFQQQQQQQQQSHARLDGKLLLASISSTTRPWQLPSWPGSNPSSFTSSTASNAPVGNAWKSDTVNSGQQLGVGTQIVTRAPTPLASLALVPTADSKTDGATNSSTSSSSTSSLMTADFTMAQQHQQQLGQRRRFFWGFGNSPASSNNKEHQGLRALTGHVNCEAAKVAGLLTAQLLMHFANLQRGVARQGDQMNQSLQWRPRFPWQRTDRAAAPASSSRQHTEWQSSEAARQWVAKGVKAEAKFELREALACYTNAVALEPSNVEYLARLAKQWSDLTYEPGADMAAINEVNMKASEYADRAITLGPQSAVGHMAACICRGRLALFSDNKTKVRLAKEAQEAARTALQLEPGNDLAHHLMGRWHFEMAQINFVVRQLIRFVYGAALAPGTFEDALSEFRTAVQLNPTGLIHRVELGRTLLRVGNKREALEQLEVSMKCEVDDINALLQKEDAELLLRKLQSEFNRHITWGVGFSNGGVSEGTAGPSSADVAPTPAAEAAAPAAAAAGGMANSAASNVSSVAGNAATASSSAVTVGNGKA